MSTLNPPTRAPYGPEAPGYGPDHDPLYDRHAPNVGDAERIGTGVIAAGLGALSTYLIAQRHYGWALPAGLAACMFAQRAATGRCQMYSAMGVTPEDADTMSGPMSRHIVVRESFSILRPARQLYDEWRKLENLPNIMSHVARVEDLGDGKSKWTVDGPAGRQVEWTAQITDDAPGEHIAWQTVDGSVEHTGSVRFEDRGKRGTIVRVQLSYHPPAGALGATIAGLLGARPSAHVREDLRRFKQRMEAGEEPTIQGQPRGTCAG